MIYPTYIRNKNSCDFCKQKNLKLYNKLISYSFGFVTCEKCTKNAEYHVINWIRQNNKISWLYFLTLLNININIEEQMFIVERTNGNIEDDWFLNINSWIIYNHECNDFLLPIIKYKHNHDFLFKKINLRNLCKYNKLFNINKCNSILKKFISIS
jgi:hypothetical protein